jgi:hypothetical protein
MSRHRHRKPGDHQGNPRDEHSGGDASDGNPDTDTAKHSPEPPNWVDKGTLVVLILAFLAAIYAGYEASRLADGTDRLVTTADDSAKRQLRAYVGIVPGDIENFGDREKQVFTMTRKNYGPTPAYDLIVTSVGQSIIKIGDPIPSGIVPPPPDIRGTITLFPSAELPFRVNRIAPTIGADLISALMQSDNVQFVYWGALEYHDAFDKRHTTNFCFMYARGKTTTKDVDGCLGHNDSD